MDPDSQTPTQEPEQNGGMPQAPTTGAGDDQAPSMPPADGGDDMPEAPEAPETPEAPEAPAGDEGDKEDGAKW